MADFRALCAELLDWAEVTAAHYIQLPAVMLRARTALAEEPAVPEGKKPTRDELWELWLRLNNELPDRPAAVAEFWEHAQIDARARAVLARWGNPAPVPAAEGEVAELEAWLREIGDTIQPSHLAEHQRYKRAAELLQRQAVAEESSVTATVPVAVSDALTKAECALADIAEGEPMTDEGDPLRWAERRCADTLAIIRPTMRQHKIRTSEWPPVPAHALPLPEAE